ncbi:TetR/AcrR family transcriptional regulator [Lysinibacillus sp. KU-BSD001]|uniref:TetR/AcrR family transcriptional regulator n=1 Tax=Lysinibacillus sp. KU-BSD001 TaxID=3141328 RepID=UPI0036E3FB6C
MRISEKRAQKKREEILKSALAIVNKKGYEGTTMEEIAAGLLMTKGSLYYYFKNKDDLIFQCHNFVLSKAVKEHEDCLQDERIKSAEETLTKMIQIHMHYALHEKESFNLIIEPQKAYKAEYLEPVLQLRRHYAGLFDEIIKRGVGSGEFTVQEPIISRQFILGGLNWVQQWVRSRGRLAYDEITDLFVKYILKILK